MLPPHAPKRAIERIACEEWGRILAALTKSLGDMQLAEDCLQDAVAKAMVVWARDGLPRTPAAWLLTTAKHRAIDTLRRDARFAARIPELSHLLETEGYADAQDPATIPDKRLEMIFTCCHPALEQKTRVALTLRTLGGLSTDAIAAAFLDTPDAIAQRLVRARRKIAAANIPYEIPDQSMLPERVAGVLAVIYLIFNAGYSSATTGRTNLSDEAIRLVRIMRGLMPDDAETAGLLALMLLHDSRRLARVSATGEMIPLAVQNRRRWDRAKITEGDRLLRDVLPRGRVGPYQLQAAISGEHARAADWEQTHWAEIVGLYDLLYQMQPSPVVRINQAVAVSYAQSVDAALALLDSVANDPQILRYQPYFATRADLCRRQGDLAKARHAYDMAISLTETEAERRFLQTQRDGLGPTRCDGV